MSEKKYVPEGAFLVCDKGTILSQLTATFHEEVSIYGKSLITKEDRYYNINFTPFGACACNQGKPCIAQVSGSQWSSLAEDVFVGENEPILEDAELQCALGGKIKIFLSRESAYASLPNGEQQERSFWQSYLAYGKGFYKGLWKGLKGTAVGLYDLSIWAGKHSTPYQLINPQGYREQILKDVETAKSLGNLAVKATKWGYRRSGYNMIANPDDYMQALKEDTQTAKELIEKAKQMSAEEIGEVAGQVAFEVGIEVATAGAGVALTAVKVGDKTLDVARGLDKLEDMADLAKTAETIEDGTKLPPVPEELGAVVNDDALLKKQKKLEQLKKNKKRAQLKKNKKDGARREREVKKELTNEGHEVIGSQVSVKTKHTRRVIDHVIKEKGTKKIKAIEVKNGNATRNKMQVKKDNSMSKDGGKIIGKNAPENLKDKTIKIDTEVRN
ncbi:DUF4280 domain-containing protein [Aquimarina sp. I32.4]|uniref:DUF4280 domain-containing protein n=1 Tax=Aquimarina sp. I32.4 TaxID=2053903 RepID=UPI000CDECA55|nr:PAAR-like protein [Aquimarina sp. I32.4]